MSYNPDPRWCTLQSLRDYRQAVLAQPGVANCTILECYDPARPREKSPAHVTVAVSGPGATPVTDETIASLQKYLDLHGATIIAHHVMRDGLATALP